MAKDTFSSKLGNFAQGIKANPVPLPMQEISPVKTAGGDDDGAKEVQLNTHVNNDLLTKVKMKALKEGKKLKQVVNEALANYVEN